MRTAKDALFSDCSWLTPSSGNVLTVRDVLECVRALGHKGHKLWPARLFDHPVEYHNSILEVGCTCKHFLPRRPNPACPWQTLRPRWCKHVAAAWYKLAFHLEDHPEDLLLMSGFTVQDFRIPRAHKRPRPPPSA